MTRASAGILFVVRRVRCTSRTWRRISACKGLAGSIYCPLNFSTIRISRSDNSHTIASFSPLLFRRQLFRRRYVRLKNRNRKSFSRAFLSIECRAVQHFPLVYPYLTLVFTMYATSETISTQSGYLYFGNSAFGAEQMASIPSYSTGSPITPASPNILDKKMYLLLPRFRKR